MRRQVRPFLITSFSAASAQNSQAHVTTGSYQRRCSKPTTEVHSHSTSSAAVHFSFARPAATTASSAATSHPDVVAPLEPAPRPPPMPCRQERTSGGNACSRAQSVGRGSWWRASDGALTTRISRDVGPHSALPKRRTGDCLRHSVGKYRHAVTWAGWSGTFGIWDAHWRADQPHAALPATRLSRWPADRSTNVCEYQRLCGASPAERVQEV